MSMHSRPMYTPRIRAIIAEFSSHDMPDRHIAHVLSVYEKIHTTPDAVALFRRKHGIQKTMSESRRRTAIETQAVRRMQTKELA